MRTLELTGPARDVCARALRSSPLFHGLSSEDRTWLLDRSELVQFEEYEALLEQGSPPNALFVLVQGAAAMLVQQDGSMQEVGRLDAPGTIGEQGLLLTRPQTTTVAAVKQVRALRISTETFFLLFQQTPTFGVAVGRALASRLKEASIEIAITSADESLRPTPETLELLPVEFIYRHRILPLRVDGKRMTLGVIEDPTTAMLTAVRRSLPGADLRIVRIAASLFDEVLERYAGILEFQKKDDGEDNRLSKGAGSSEDVGRSKPDKVPEQSPRLNQILARQAAEGASDLHLSAGQRPFWRVDGGIKELTDARKLGPNEVYELCEPTLSQLALDTFNEHHDADYAISTPDGNRFRVSMYREHGGVSAVFRAIPNSLMTPQQLGLPPVVQKFCHFPKGLVLVTGPTGSGKTTTLAALIDYVNTHTNKHIITLEDPIEFVHLSKRCLINQREIGPHAKSFRRALRSALRQDPDIVLVGEMRDIETVDLALETAATGHLVFGTMHTATAGQTLERIVGMFPADEQNRIRQTAAEAIRGVICQTLCKKIGGGRVAAFEVLVVSNAITAMLREGKSHQLETAMTTGRKYGNIMLNDDLARLVRTGLVEVNEAMKAAVDREEFAKKLDPVHLAALKPIG